VSLPAPRCDDLAPCPVCGCGVAREVLASKDLVLGVPGLFRYVECAECRTSYQSPRVRAEDLALCYPPAFYTHGTGGEWRPTPAPQGSLREQLRRSVRNAADGRRDTASPVLRPVGALLALHADLRRRARLGLVDGLSLPEGSGGRLLEVGPGQGIDLYCLRTLGWDACGLEVDPVAAARARETSGADVHVGTLASTDLPDASFDLVYMSHVLEHLHEPGPALRRAFDLLKPGGSMVLLYPNPRALTARRHGALSLVWDPPRHLALPPLPAAVGLVRRTGFVEIRARTLAWRAAVNSEAARRRRCGQVWDPLNLRPPRLTDRLFALVESALVGMGLPVGEEILLRARKAQGRG